MTISKKNLALGALITAGVGTAITYPLSTNPFIGILHHGFMAATVGGLADWFGITALFHKPLGIGYHTNVLINNRKRIEADLSNFICNDLLSVENILEATKDIPFAQLIIDYLNSSEGNAALSQVIKPLLNDFMQKIDLNSLKQLAASEIPHTIEKLNLSKSLLDIIEQIVRKDYLNPSIDLVLITLKNYAAYDEDLRGIIANLIDAASQKYTDDMLLRQIFAKISVDEITNQCLNAAKNYLQDLRNPEHELRQKLKIIVLDKILTLRSDETFSNKINYYATQLAIEKLAPVENLLISKDATPIYIYLEEKLREVNENEKYKANFDTFLRKILKIGLEKKHITITKLVTDKLASYTDEELVNTIESRVGDDLQMIRLNGTIVGGIAGMLLYLITILAEGMWIQ